MYLPSSFGATNVFLLEEIYAEPMLFLSLIDITESADKVILITSSIFTKLRGTLTLTFPELSINNELSISKTGKSFNNESKSSELVPSVFVNLEISPFISSSLILIFTLSFNLR